MAVPGRSIPPIGRTAISSRPNISLRSACHSSRDEISHRAIARAPAGRHPQCVSGAELFGHEPPIGRYVLRGEDATRVEVVGVVRESRIRGSWKSAIVSPTCPTRSSADSSSQQPLCCRPHRRPGDTSPKRCARSSETWMQRCRSRFRVSSAGSTNRWCRSVCSPSLRCSLARSRWCSPAERSRASSRTSSRRARAKSACGSRSGPSADRSRRRHASGAGGRCRGRDGGPGSQPGRRPLIAELPHDDRVA